MPFRPQMKLICIDRVLVRIGHHRDENISLFDEAKQVWDRSSLEHR